LASFKTAFQSGSLSSTRGMVSGLKRASWFNESQ
jgi:hypothetical protein